MTAKPLSSSYTKPAKPSETSKVAVPPWWRVDCATIDAFVDTSLKRGTARVLARSSGDRPVYCIEYGPSQTHLRGTANFNAACGAKDSEYHFRHSRREQPVLMVIAGVHGAEVEGMAGAMSLWHILETGSDLCGKPQEKLAKVCEKCRVVIVPCANPDGRARCPYDGFAGISDDEMHRINQGTRSDGTAWGWPLCKSVHPMRENIGVLGCYFDDAGVNLMHDEWHHPLSPVTRPLLDLVAAEAPDVALNLHSYQHPPKLIPLSWVPLETKKRLVDLATSFNEKLDSRNIRHLGLPGTGCEQMHDGTPPALNLTSMLFHAGARLSATFESPHGLLTHPFTYGEILDIHHELFAVSAEQVFDKR